MKLKLKEDPSEWQKHLLVMALLLEILCAGFLMRGRLAPGFFRGVQLVLAAFLAALLLRPRGFRAAYRAWVTGNYFIGKFVGRVMLTLFYFLILTPLGLLLRCTGRDLLKLRGLPPDGSYWQKCRPPSGFDRMF